MKQVTAQKTDRLGAPGLFYVYEVTDPRTETVIYVGCGSANRVKTSGRSSRRGPMTAYEERIADIRRAGFEPIKRIASVHHWKGEALRAEAALILALEAKGVSLLNRVVFHFSQRERPPQAAQPSKSPSRGALALADWCGRESGYAKPCPFIPRFFPLV